MKIWTIATFALSGLLTACVLLPQSAPRGTSTIQRTVQPSPTPTEGAIWNWKTYDSSTYGFFLSYPANFILEEQPISPGIALCLSFTSPADPGDPSQYEPPFALIVYTNPESQPLVDWFSAHMSDPPEYGQAPAKAVAFYTPRIENQDQFQGRPALQYESGAWPIRYEKLVEQDGWIISLYYHRDHPFDYGPVYDQVLASLELTQALSTPAAPPTVVQPTLTPIVCLDDQAMPQTVPPREPPLEVRFISDGNIWLWEEGTPARQLSDTGDALRFTFSPDGEVVVFERVAGDYPWRQYKIELWAVNRDSSNLRRLVSAEKFDELLPGREEAWVANLPRDYRWLAGTHQLSFGVYQYINAVGAEAGEFGYWIINVDTLALDRWNNPEIIDTSGSIAMSSPDGKLIAQVKPGSISLLNADGSIIGTDVLTYTEYYAGEGSGWGVPTIVWSSDSLTLKVVVWEGDPFTNEIFSTWDVSVDGSTAKKLNAFSGMEYYAYISPNQEYIAYLERIQPMSNDHALHLAKFDGSADVIYATGYTLYFQGWAPDSIHFAYDLFPTHQPLFGSLCGGYSELVDKSQSPATQITWVDAEHFLFVVGQESQPKELMLGQVGGESLLIGPFNGEGAYYQVRQEGQDVISR